MQCKITGKNGIVSSRISALNVIKVWDVKQSITEIGTGSINQNGQNISLEAFKNLKKHLRWKAEW